MEQGSASATEPPRHMDFTRHVPSFPILAALCLLTASCAHHSEGTPVQTSNDIPAANAATDSREIGGKLLALIDSIRSRRDLAQAHIERVTGLKLNTEPETVYLYGAGGAIADGWSYRLGATAGDDDGVDSLLFTFNHAGGENVDMAPICDPDFDAYRAALQEKGFDAKQVPGDRGSTRFWEFSRDGVTVRIRTIGESRARPEHACVSTISIRA
jgi:hypothetical protein